MARKPNDTRRAEFSRLRFHNPRTAGLTIILEPWGEVLAIRPGTTVDVICTGPPGEGPEVTYDDNTITVWGWAGSVLHLVPEGADLTSVRAGRPAVPGDGPAATRKRAAESAVVQAPQV